MNEKPKARTLKDVRIQVYAPSREEGLRVLGLLRQAFPQARTNGAVVQAEATGDWLCRIWLDSSADAPNSRVQ